MKSNMTMRCTKNKAAQILIYAYLVCVMPVYANDETSTWKFSGGSELFGSNTKKHGFNASIFLRPIKFSGGPIAERTFLNPTDTIQFSGNIESVTNPLLGYESDGMDGSLKFQRVMGRHIVSPNAFYATFEGFSTLGSGVDYAYIVRPGTHAYVNTAIGREEHATGSAASTSVDVGYRRLWQYKSGRALVTNVHSKYTRSGNESRKFSILEFGASLDYYFTRRWNVGLGLKLADSDVPIHQTFGLDLSTEYYFSERFSVNFDVEAENYLPDSSASLGITWFFR